MPTVIPQRELRNDNAKVIERVVAGEHFVVTRNGVPVAELRPVAAPTTEFVRRDDLRSWAGLGPSIDAARFRADLDDVADQHL